MAKGGADLRDKPAARPHERGLLRRLLARVAVGVGGRAVLVGLLRVLVGFLVVPGLVAVILVVIAGMLASLTIAREWEMGTMEQLLSTPVRPAELVLAKMLGFFAVGVVDTIIAVLVGIFVFGVPFRGSVLLLAFTSCLFLCGVFFWGILVSALARTQLVAYQMGVATTFLPSFLLSGFVYSIDGMPKVVQAITHIVPARYFVTILRGIFLKGVGATVLWEEILFLVAFMTSVFLLATWRLSQKLT